jgi:hypothetical protein
VLRRVLPVQQAELTSIKTRPPHVPIAA